MTNPSKQPDWHDWLQAGLSASNPTSSHVVDDEELIACWAEGLLGADEEAALREHLSACVACRTRISEMILDGSLNIKPAAAPDVEERSESDRIDVRREGPRDSGRNWMAAALALAACLLVAFLWSAGADESGQLALARAELEKGESDAAYQRLSAYLGDEKVKSLDADAAELLEDAAYQTARAKLLAGDFDAVSQVAGESSSLGVTSGRLTNLDLQAARGLPVEDSLAEFGTLLAYGYDLDGFARVKALPVVDAKTDKLLARTSDAATQYPAEEQLLLNRAQLLLSLQRADEARELFLSVLGRSPESSAAHLGAGLAAFELGDYEAAAEAFGRVLESNPHLVDALVNRAITLDRMGRTTEATQEWRDAASKSQDERLRDSIRERLDFP